MTRIITFTGAQGTGKTTMRKALVEYLQNKGYTTIEQYPDVNESIARDAKEIGFVINEATTFEAQYYIASMFIVKDLQLRKLVEKTVSVDFIVLDRCVLDVIPYTNLAVRISTYQKDLIINMLYAHYKMYQTGLFYCEPLSVIEKDRGRSTNKNFQDDIVKEFEKILRHIGQHQRYSILPDEHVAGRLSRVIQRIDV